MTKVKCRNIQQIKRRARIVDIPISQDIKVSDTNLRTENLIPQFNNLISEENLLKFEINQLQRCAKCVLPKTMPFINFDDQGYVIIVVIMSLEIIQNQNRSYSI